MQQNFSDYSKESRKHSEIDFGKIIRYLLMQSKMIAFVVMATLIITTFFYVKATKQYKVVSLLQVEATNQSVFDPTNTLDVSSGQLSSDIDSLIALYKSRTNILKLITDLKLNIEIDGLNEDESIDIDIRAIDDSNYSQSFYIRNKGSVYELLNQSQSVIGIYNYNELINHENLNIVIKNPSLKINKELKVSYKNPTSLYRSIDSRLRATSATTVNIWNRQNGLIEVSFITDDVNSGMEIINYANQIFLDYRINSETEKARKAIAFIDKNIASLEGVVEKNKQQLKLFREANKSLNVDLQIEGVINKIQSIDNSLYEVEVELSNAAELYTLSNPIYLKLVNKKNLLIEQKESIIAAIKGLPKEQQEYIDLYNNVQISQNLYEELESRKLGFSILEASTIGNIRVVDPAYTLSKVSPKLSMIIFTTFASFIFICIFAIFRGLNFLPITNPAELFDNNIQEPVVGVIPLLENIDNAKEDISFNSSIESLMVNLRSIQSNDPNKKVIIITSPSPYNGKSTISSNLAESLQKIGKKVLLIDNDLKRGKLASKYNIRNISESKFLDIDSNNISDFKISDNFYFIPRVKNLINSFQFICSNQYQEKINFFRDYFDYIVLDTAPILSIADTPILISKSDISFLVVRHGLSRINEIKQSMDGFNQINRKIDGFIYNAYSRPNSYYGYYSLYGDYSYQYYAEKYLEDAYEYKKDN